MFNGYGDGFSWEDSGGGNGGGWGGGTFSDYAGLFRTGLSIYQQFDDPPQGGGPDINLPATLPGNGGMMPTGALGGAVAAGGIWLGSYLARAFGRSAAAAVYTAANGIRVRISQLWPLVRRYGPETVAGALGITIGGLGTLLMQPGARTGTRRRARGITARDVKTTSRTIKKLRKLTRLAGIGGGGGYRRRSYSRPRRSGRGHYGWH